MHWKNFVYLINKNFEGKKKVNIINAACSDGSEAYSLAIIMKERLDEAQCKKFFPIKASDYDKKIIDVASNKVIFEVKNGKIVCEGKNLKIISFVYGDAVIKGEVIKVEKV